MNYFCEGYTTALNEHFDCPKGANSWSELDNGQCDDCHNLQNNITPCDCAECVTD